MSASIHDELQALILEEALAQAARDETRKTLADLRRKIEAKRNALAQAKAKQREDAWLASQPVRRQPQRACGDTNPQAYR